MMFNRIFLMIGLLSAGIIASSVQGIVETFPDTPIKCTKSTEITHYAQYNKTGSLVASYNAQNGLYSAALVTEYGSLRYALEDAEALFKLFEKKAMVSKGFFY